MSTACPLPHIETERVLLGHGAGGRLSAELIDSVVLPALDGQEGPLEDAALLAGTDLVVSTDSFVVSPMFFPGGDIGALAVHGTVNDVSMRGAEPLALTMALVIEEGLPISELRSVLASLGKAARDAGVPVVAGDTKVVGRGAADRLFITGDAALNIFNLLAGNVHFEVTRDLVDANVNGGAYVPGPNADLDKGVLLTFAISLDALLVAGRVYPPTLT